MDRWLIALTVPVFFALIGLEWLAARRKGRVVYRLQDSIASLSTGILQQTSDLWLGAAALASYVLVFEHARLVEPLSMTSAWHWLLAALGVDFLYYWFHRASHRINLLWAAHVVHHQSEEYNLTTALRQSTLQPLLNAPFFWPLALLGVPPSAAVLVFTVDVLYQFWVHTRLIPALGPLEYLLCTPSNHRVHHGIDPEYIDKNYGGVLIVWDRLFGTYQAERQEPSFGTVTPLRSWNPVWANLAYFKTLATRARAARGPREWLYTWFAPPEWRPIAEGGPATVPPVDHRTRRFYRPPASPPRHVYVVVQYVWTVLVLLTAMVGGDRFTQPQQITLALWLTASIAAWGGLFEGRSWVRGLEWLRLLGAPALAYWLLPSLAFELSPTAIGALAAVQAALSLTMLTWLAGLLRPGTPV